jgi:hypothetical protein
MRISDRTSFTRMDTPQHQQTELENKQASIRIAEALTYAGALPFFLCTIGMFYPGWSATTHATLASGLTTYAAVIISFLGGIQWGVGVATIDQQPRSARTLFLLSVVPSLLAWGMLFLQSTPTRIVIAITLVGFVWLIDTMLHIQRVIPTWFFRLRTTISVIVIASLLLALLTTAWGTTNVPGSRG